MLFTGYAQTLLEGLHEDILGIVEFHEVARNFLEVAHEVLLQVVLCEVGIITCWFIVIYCIIDICKKL